MARFLCDFYVYKAPQQLVAKYVNAILTEGEAQASANSLLKQHGAKFVCVEKKSSASGAPRAPIKSSATGNPTQPCWVVAPQVAAQTATCPPGYVFEGGKCVIKSPIPPKCPPGTQLDPTGKLCVPILKTGPGGRVLRKPGIVAGPFDGIGRTEGDGMLGATTLRFVIAAWNGNKLVGQWGYDLTSTGAWGSKAEGGPSGAAAFHNWSKAKAKGATRVCAALIEAAYGNLDKSFQTPGAKFVCFDGKHYWQQGQTAAQQINCPAGQFWDNVAKKCVSAQSNAGYGEGASFGFPAPKPLVSRGEMPHQGPLTQTNINTSFLRPQLSGLPFSLGNVGDPPNLTGKYKGILLLWSKSPGVSSPVPNFGTLIEDLSPTWNCMREGRMLSGFSKWWNSKGGNKISEGYFPTSGACKGILVADLDAQHTAALDAFAAGATAVVDPNAAGQWPTTNPDPTAALACTDICQKNFGAASPAGLNLTELLNCLAQCSKTLPPIQPIPGGGAQPPPGGGLPPPPAPKPPQGGTPPPSGVTDCDGKNPCPAGQVCVGGKCQPALPPPPVAPGAAAAKSSNVGLWIAGGVAVLGAAALIFGGGKSSLLLNPYSRPGERERHLQYREALAAFKRRYAGPKNDKPRMGEAWSNYIDELARAGLITEAQASRWDNPFYR